MPPKRSSPSAGSDSALPPKPAPGIPKGRTRKPVASGKAPEAGSSLPGKAASTYRTPGGFTQTPVYLTDTQRRALYARAGEASAKAGKRISIGEIMREALNQYLGLEAEGEE